MLQMELQAPIEGYQALNMDTTALPPPRKIKLAGQNVAEYKTSIARHYWYTHRHPLFGPKYDSNLPDILPVIVPDWPFTEQFQDIWPTLWKRLTHPLIQDIILSDALYSTYLMLHRKSLLHRRKEAFRTQDDHYSPNSNDITSDSDLHKVALCPAGCSVDDSHLHAFATCPVSLYVWRTLWKDIQKWIGDRDGETITQSLDSGSIITGWPGLHLRNRARLRLLIWHIIVVGAIDSTRFDSFKSPSHRMVTAERVINQYQWLLQRFLHKMKNTPRWSSILSEEQELFNPRTFTLL